MPSGIFGREKASDLAPETSTRTSKYKFQGIGVQLNIRRHLLQFRPYENYLGNEFTVIRVI